MKVRRNTNIKSPLPPLFQVESDAVRSRQILFGKMVRKVECSFEEGFCMADAMRMGVNRKHSIDSVDVRLLFCFLHLRI